ncbi:HAD hydrolase family protein, partial [Erysipelothrix rhusiopathiae]|nr:HAD hydrolase family protein [Erysipelothrix rhusiopathiae]
MITSYTTWVYFSNSEHVITDRTREVIHAARNQGYEFMLATGRNYESAASIAEAL